MKFYETYKNKKCEYYLKDADLNGTFPTLIPHCGRFVVEFDSEFSYCVESIGISVTRPTHLLDHRPRKKVWYWSIVVAPDK